MRRHGFLIAALLLLVGVGALAASWLTKPQTLRVAVGPLHSEDVRLVAGLVQAAQREKGGLRLKLVLADDPKKAAALLDDGKVDLAVARSDVAVPEHGLTAVVLRRAVVVLLVRADRGLTRIADLKGKTIGAPKAAPENLKLLRTILAQYELPEESIRIDPIEGDAAAALRDGRVDAIYLVGSTLSRPLTDAIATIARGAGDAGVAILPIREAAAIAARNPALESTDLVAGAFGGEPPRPADMTPTVSITHRLMASRDLNNDTVGDLTRFVLDARLALASELPLAQGIEAPSTEKNAALGAHPGAAAYIDGEQESFFDKYSDWFYLVVMVMSVVGSGAAAVIGRVNSRKRNDAMAGLTRLLAILHEARAADDDAALAKLEQEADVILVDTLARAAQGDLDEAGLSAYRLAMDQTARGIAERRLLIARDEAIAAQ
ncbi:ABC transporter substrate-binding protein [Terrarubrum flagellatum]|uniref:ABC transporter substrate-binding protein n=1 Tax=Terrirubrum flagellatum TaxID=2895980 RepID=UPI003144F7DB